jgi:hypothetical protein
MDGATGMARPMIRPTVGSGQLIPKLYSLRVATLEDDFPCDLLAKNRRGQIIGSSLYRRGRAQSRRVGRHSC